MIYVIGGMPRAGSRLYFHLIEELMISAGHPSAEELRSRFGSELPLRALDRFHLGKLITFDRLSRRENITFAIRTHTAPTLSIQTFMKLGRFKGTYVYRDPRDVIISALERGRIMREKGDAKRAFGFGPYRTFARLYTVEGALRWFKWQQYPRWKRWARCQNVHMSRYEDVVSETYTESKKLCDFFGLDVSDEDMNKISSTFNRTKQTDRTEYYSTKYSAGGGKLLNKGIIGRYKEVLTDSEQELCRQYLGKCLDDMGYEY